MNHVVDIEWWRLALCGLVLSFLLGVSRKNRLDLEKTLGIAAIRGTVQLLGIGYVLGAIFALDRWELVAATLLVMLSIAAWTASARLPRRLPGLRLFVGGALAAGMIVSLAFMTEAVIGVTPWYDPQHLIPLGGMILGNAMNAASLGGERFQEEIASRRDEIETRLALGWSGTDALHLPLSKSLRAAMIPTVNALMVAGLVQLPGIMTGQIVAGVEPMIAVKYQLVVFFGLLLSTSTSTWLFLVLLRSRYLTSAHQLRSERILALPASSRGVPRRGRRRDG